jgi:hypothetical protein
MQPRTPRRRRARSLRSAEAPGTEIVVLMTEFERSVAAADDELVGRNWPQIDVLLSQQRQLTIALLRALEATRSERPVAFTNEVQRRAVAIFERRGDQLRRLIAFNHAVGSRLSVIARTRQMRRGYGDDASKPRIFDDLR